jgi:hypothetical protein
MLPLLKQIYGGKSRIKRPLGALKRIFKAAPIIVAPLCEYGVLSILATRKLFLVSISNAIFSGLTMAIFMRRLFQLHLEPSVKRCLTWRAFAAICIAVKTGM